jgi:hypothetical protein
MTNKKMGTRDLWSQVENEAVRTAEYWKNMNDDERLGLVANFMKIHQLGSELRPISCGEDGMIYFDQVVQIPVNLRADALLDLEDALKVKIDKGLTVWIQPQSDKNALRKLRGVEVKSL